MKLEVTTPHTLVDINRLPLGTIEVMEAGARIGVLDVHFLDIADPHIDPIGARGLGEIPITGVAAAVANAVFHSTGRRIRDLPITAEQLVS